MSDALSDPIVNAIARVLCCGKACGCGANSLDCFAEDHHGTAAAALKTVLPRLGFYVVDKDGRTDLRRDARARTKYGALP